MLKRNKNQDTKKTQAGTPVKSQARSQEKAAPKTKKQPAEVPVKVPAEYVFWCHDGSVFEDLEQLAEGLAAMSDETFEYHSNQVKHDFANWIRDIIRDEELAEELAQVNNGASAARSVAARLPTLR
jgi:hypothetical protein